MADRRPDRHHERAAGSRMPARRSVSMPVPAPAFAATFMGDSTYPRRHHRGRSMPTPRWAVCPSPARVASGVAIRPGNLAVDRRRGVASLGFADFTEWLFQGGFCPHVGRIGGSPIAAAVPPRDVSAPGATGSSIWPSTGGVGRRSILGVQYDQAAEWYETIPLRTGLP